MNFWSRFFVFSLFLALVPQIASAAGGITPEQIYQKAIHWPRVYGTWEILPEENPLAENGTNRSAASRSVRSSGGHFSRFLTAALIALKRDSAKTVISAIAFQLGSPAGIAFTAGAAKVELQPGVAPMTITAQDAVTLLLGLIRSSAVPTEEHAPGGFFQQSLPGNVAAQLVRVGIPSNAGMFAEAAEPEVIGKGKAEEEEEGE